MAGQGQHDSPVQLRIAGDLCSETVADFEFWAEHVTPAPGRTCALDLGEIVFIDSRGVNLLLRARDEMAARGVALEIASASRTVRRILDILGLDRRLVPVDARAGARFTAPTRTTRPAVRA